MAAAGTQISAVITDATRERLERFAKKHGLKKSHLIETAILHHLAALEELPTDVFVPPVITLARNAGRDVRDRIEHPEPPTKAMKALFDAD